MELYDNTFLNLILLLFPILIYLICMAYDSNIDKKNNILLLDMALISSLHLITHYGMNFLLMFNIPLIIAYVKKRKLSIIFTSFMIVRYYYLFSDFPISCVICEYVLYALLKYLLGATNKIFVGLILLIKSGIYILWINHNIASALSISLIFILTTILVLFMLSKVERVMELHNINSRIKKDEEFRTSLFKITHEIKNPIAVIKGYLDMFDVNNLEHAKKYVPIMRDEISRLLVLLEDFLSMNKIKVNKEIIDINLLLEEAIANLDSVLTEYHIDKEIELYDDDIYINGDFNRLTQVIVNIIKNSIEARKDSDDYIKISTEIVGDVVRINILDNGWGISPTDLKRISEPFFTTKKRGTGLGVSLSYEIIEAHDGNISYESNYGEYTLVTIDLPLCEVYH